MASAWMRLVVLLCGVHTTLEVRIHNCNNNKVEIFEDSPAPVTCRDIGSAAVVEWRRGDGVNIGDCKVDGTCTSALYNDYRLSRSPQSTESQLTLVPDYRRHAGLTVTCQEKGSLFTPSCTLVISRHSVISECQVTTDTVNWTVSGSCRVQEAFSSDNIYTCTWTLGDQTSGSLSEDRERCLFTQQLPKVVGKYTYNVSVFPPATSGSPQTIEIASPGDLSIFCPRVVLEGSSFVVACETETAGSPPAIVRLEGEKDGRKVISSVPRTANGTQFRCHVTWGGVTNSTSYYTLLVAYGPDIVSIRSSSPSNSTNTSLVCSASEAYPAVIYSWQGACAEVTRSADGSTCLVSQPISDTDVITCTAVNSLFDISVTTSYSPGPTGTQPLIAAAVGGAAAGVIILTAVSVVVVLYILRKRKDGMYASTTRGREESHPYMDLEMRGQGQCETTPTSSDSH